MFGALGEGFLGRGAELNQALTHAPRLTANTGSFAAAVLARPGAAGRLVPAAQSLSAALAPVSGELASGFAPGARALGPLSAERASVQAALTLAPGALNTTRSGLAEADPLLAETAGFARAAVALTRIAPASLRQATALLQAAPQPLRAADPLARALSAAVPGTLKLTGGLDPLISPAVRALDHALPILTSVGARGCDFLGFVRNWRSLLGYGQAGGGELGPSNYVMVGVAANADLASPSSAKPASLIGHDPYPSPCTAATEHLG
jgi:ABC-type transporter Mla subunit MlaD